MPHCTGRSAGRPTVARLAQLCAVAGTLVLLVACEPATLFVTDPFADAIVEHAGEERRRIEELLTRAPQPEEYLRIELDEDPVAVLQGVFDPEAPELVFLTPYLAAPAVTLAEQYGQTQFIVLGQTQQNQTGPRNGKSNVVTVSFDRTGAMSEAGRIAATYLRRQDTGSRLLLLSVVDSPGRRREVDAFVEAFRNLAGSGAGDAVPTVEEELYEELPTRDELRSRLRDVQNEYSAIAVFLGRRSPYVIEQVSTGNLPYGSENLGLFDPLLNRMLFSVETRLSDALQAYLDSRESEAAAITANARLIRGPAVQGGESSEKTPN